MNNLERKELARRLDPDRRLNEWQPIETAPKDGTVILLWSRYASHPTTAAWEGDRWVCQADGHSAIESQSDFGTTYREFDVPSHWRPLPAPPADEN
jgi:hypothetical protein